MDFFPDSLLYAPTSSLKQLRNMTLTSTALIILFAVCIASTVNGQANMMKNVIVATGVGKRSFKTSIAVIRLGVRKKGPSAGIVNSMMASSSSRLVSYLKSQRVSKLQTTSVYISSVYNYRVSPRRITGYQGSSTLSFEVPISRAGEILDGATSNGATQISSVSFRGTDQVGTNARRYAIMDAVMRARIEVLTATSALRRSLGPPIHIKITDSYMPQPLRAPMARSAMPPVPGRPSAAPPPTPIIAQEQTVRAYVTVSFAMY